jgi:hypothetical protein
VSDTTCAFVVPAGASAMTYHRLVDVAFACTANHESRLQKVPATRIVVVAFLRNPIVGSHFACVYIEIITDNM